MTHLFSCKPGKQSEHTDRCPQLQNKTFGGFCKQTTHCSLLKVLRSLILVSILEFPITWFRNPIYFSIKIPRKRSGSIFRFRHYKLHGRSFYICSRLGFDTYRKKN